MLGVASTAVAYGYYSSHPETTQPRPLIGNLDLRSISVAVTSLNRSGLTLDIDAVVDNPNGFGATLDSANYSVYADGHYFGSGRISHSYSLAPQSSATLVFPISVGWRSALGAMGGYVTGLGHVEWEVEGNARVSIGGLSVSGPFEFTAG